MMDTVRQYIQNIACFTLFALLLQLLIGNTGRQGINFILGVMLLLLICRPLEVLFHTELTFPVEFARMSVQDTETLREEMITNGIKAELEQELVRRTNAQRAEVELNDDGSVGSVVLFNADPSQAETAALLCGTENIIFSEE